MQRGQRSFFFPPYVIFLSLLAENSQCDNRGTLSSSSRPCSCKVCMQYGGLQSEILGLCSNHLLLNLLFISRFVSASVFFFLLSPFMREMSLKGRWITYVHVCACVCVCVCACTCVCVCVLQNNVAGALCDECKPGFFHLSEANPEGCLRCFCMGVTRQCASSTWTREQVGCQASNS